MSAARTLGLTLRTVRHLRLHQVVARATLEAERAFVALRPSALARRYARQFTSVEVSGVDAASEIAWPDAYPHPSNSALADILAGRYTFLHESRELGDPPDWKAPGAARLWRFQLHYFAYAVDLAAAAGAGDDAAYQHLRRLVLDWQAHHPPSTDDAWHPFVVSSRLLSWLQARYLLRPRLAADPDFAQAWRRSIVTHALYLYEHFEHDVGGNHLLKNGVALLAAGCSFDGPPSERWRSRAAAVLEREVARQVLADGGHYERSPMYHLLVLTDLEVALAAATARRLRIAATLGSAVRSMRLFAASLRHPDGEIPLLNDAVFDEAPPLVAFGSSPRLPLAPRLLASSGYALMPVGDALLIADCGPPGPDDLPAHVHADALSFELSDAAERLLVDGGMHDYEPGPLRLELRGTRSHNTVEVDGRDQSEVWGTFRVGRRAHVRMREWHVEAGHASLVAAHDGYRYLGVREHERRFDAVDQVGWRVLDTLSGRGSHHAVSRLRLAPGLTWQWRQEEWLVVDEQRRIRLRVRPIGAPAESVESGHYAPRFGHLQSAQVLTLRRQGALPILFGYWLLLPNAHGPTVL